MAQWNEFEIQCTNFLNKKFGLYIGNSPGVCYNLVNEKGEFILKKRRRNYEQSRRISKQNGRSS